MQPETEKPEVNPGMAPKLTDWANEPTVADLKSDLEASKPAHDARLLKIREWKSLFNVTGKNAPKAQEGRSKIQPKLVRKQAEWRYAALTEPFLSSDKLYDVKPATFEDVKSALQNDTVLNWQWRTKLPRVRFIDTYVRAAVDEGSVITRLGWSRQTTKVKEIVPVWGFTEVTDPEAAQMIEQTALLKSNNPREYEETVPDDMKESVSFYEENQVFVMAQQIGEEEIEVEKILSNKPVVKVENPENFYVDPTCEDDLDKANFAVVSFTTSNAELKKEPERYRNLEFVNWDDAALLMVPDHESSTDNNFNFSDSLRKKIVAYEYWGFYDIHNTGELVPIVATWVGSTMIRMEENPFPDRKIPFVVESYMPIKRELFGEADAELLGDNQAVLGALMRGMIDLLGRSANSQQGIAKGMLDTVNRKRFDRGLDYEFNPNFNPAAGGLHEHVYPEFPTSGLTMMNLQHQEAESLTGVKSFSGGISGEAYGDVAAGIRGVLDAASKREMAILRRLANGIKSIGDKIIAMNSVFLSEEEVIRVTNDEFVTVNREDLAGNFDLIVDISTAEVDNKKAQDLAFMLQTMGNTVEFPIVRMMLVQIARLQRMPDLAKAIEQFEPQPDPLEQQLKEIAIQEAMKKVELLESQIELNKAKAERELQEANKRNLDTTEQETGTTHEREMAKQKGQSQGNQDLAITNALTKPRKEGESNPDIEAALGFNALSKEQPNANSSTIDRDIAAETDPRLSLGSAQFDPALDPALNPAMHNI